jgi:hypothetical protein
MGRRTEVGKNRKNLMNTNGKNEGWRKEERRSRILEIFGIDIRFNYVFVYIYTIRGASVGQNKIIYLNRRKEDEERRVNYKF